jgi:radical SAM protein with 4Fe4S-binding SPASM domain
MREVDELYSLARRVLLDALGVNACGGIASQANVVKRAPSYNCQRCVVRQTCTGSCRIDAQGVELALSVASDRH